MFDCALHFRFLQKATEAMFEMGQASVAAALACQRRVYDEMTPEELRPPEPPANPWANNSWSAWFGDWAQVPQVPTPAQPDLMQSWLAMASACSMSYWTGGQAAPAARVMAMSNPALPASMQAFKSFWSQSWWGMSPWTLYQPPMVAMMLSYGVPYAVAAPTARASTSAMDAADAACEQWRLVFGSNEGRKSLERNLPFSSHSPRYLH